MSRPRLATVWLDGCSGCHMSFLDLDEALLDIAVRADIVYSPLVDHKEFPEGVDVALVEGAVSTDDDVRRIQTVRARTKWLVALGDCAVTSNVPGLRNPIGAGALLAHVYGDAVPETDVPALLRTSRPIHAVVDVDVFVPGCPPGADVIQFVISELLEGRVPDVTGRTWFGA